MDGGAWWAAVHGVAEGWTRLSNFTFTFHFHALEKEMATHFSVLAWRIPWMEEPGRLQSMGSLRVWHDWATSLSLPTFMHWRRKWQPTSVFCGDRDGWDGRKGGRQGQEGEDICMLLLLSHFSHFQLCATPETAAHQAPPSLGFSRQEQWSGLPFPSPMHESEKWRWSRSVVSDS